MNLINRWKTHFFGKDKKAINSTSTAEIVFCMLVEKNHIHCYQLCTIQRGNRAQRQ